MAYPKTKRLFFLATTGLVILASAWAFVALRNQNLMSHNAWIEAHRLVGRSNQIVQAERQQATQMQHPNFTEMNSFLDIIGTQLSVLESLHQEGQVSFAKLKLDPESVISTASKYLDSMSKFQQQLLDTRIAEHQLISVLENIESGATSLSDRDLNNLVKLRLSVEKLSKLGQENITEDISQAITELKARSQSLLSVMDGTESSQLEEAVLIFSNNLTNLKTSTENVLAMEELLNGAALELFYSVDAAAEASQPRINMLFTIVVLELLAVAAFFVFISYRLKEKLVYHNEELENIVKVRTERLEIALAELKESSEQQKKIEEELRLAQRLEAIGQLAAGIAHEINTPSQFVNDNLQFILDAHEDLARIRASYANAAKEFAASSGDHKFLDDMQNLEDEIDLEFLEEEVPSALRSSLDGMQRISKIIKSMKDFSHPGADVRELADINKALETTLDVAQNEWKYVATIEREFAQDLPKAPVFAAELNQVFLNIIVNAGQAIAEKNAETGSTDMGIIHIKTGYDDTHIDLHIRDSGCGIPQENIDRVFDPFFTTKEVGKGTGQGLSIARKIVVDQHDGVLNLSSEVGQFTEFHIRLPRTANKSELPKKNATKPKENA